ncbi:unnamed protein product [Vicia faba]|uniref:Uncharacterized protein n=1 Tax=Vicia faba TaxID=3906 RepID=A0AAV0ZR13_VICFA|nr:unnamed protein product [Vicia faba]
MITGNNLRFFYRSPGFFKAYGVCVIFFKSLTASVYFVPHGGGFFLSNWDRGHTYLESLTILEQHEDEDEPFGMENLSSLRKLFRGLLSHGFQILIDMLIDMNQMEEAATTAGQELSAFESERCPIDQHSIHLIQIRDPSIDKIALEPEVRIKDTE